MSKLMLIDEEWIDKYIKNEEKLIIKYPIHNEKFTEAKRKAELLREVKKQLQSPVEEIKRAIEHGLWAREDFDRTSNYDAESRAEGLQEIQDEYLKQNNYTDGR